MKINYFLICWVVLGVVVLDSRLVGSPVYAEESIKGPAVAVHAQEAQNGEHSEDADDDQHGEEVVRLSDDALREFGIELSPAQSGTIDQYVELPGEIVLNADRLAHVVPRVAGIARDVRKTVGDSVSTGDILAVLDSRELADAKAAYLAACEREKVAQTHFEREERLWQKKVTSEQEFLDARQVLAEAHIAKTLAEQQLHTLGCSEADLKALPGKHGPAFTHYEITAPFGGTIIERHLTLGENVTTETQVFTIADLSTVWADIDVYQKDLADVLAGQTVVIETGRNFPTATGKIAWVGPIVGETTRTAKARVVLANPDGKLRPGLFFTARVVVGSQSAGIVVPKSALQTFEGHTVVFKRTDKGFEPQPVELGHQNGHSVEIISGLTAGQMYVSQGAFTLKAQLSKGAFGDGHNH